MTFRRSLLSPLIAAAVAAVAAPAALADAPWSAPIALPAGAQGAAPSAAMTAAAHAGVAVANDGKAFGATGAASALLRLDAAGAIVANDPLGIADAHVVAGGADSLFVAGSSLSTVDGASIDDTSHLRVATTLGAGGRITIAPVHGSTGLHVAALAANAAGDIAVVGADTTRRVVYLRTARQRLFHPVLTIKATNKARGATVALGPKGDVLVVWEDRHVVSARHRGTGGRWAETHRLGAGIQSDLQALIDDTGRQIVVWKSQRVNEGESASPATVNRATAAARAPWGRARVIETVDLGGAGRYVPSPGVRLVPTGASVALLAWTGADAGRSVVRAVRLDRGQVGPPQTVSPPGVEATLGDATAVPGTDPNDARSLALILWRSGGDAPRLFANVRSDTSVKFGGPEPVTAPGTAVTQPPVALLAPAARTPLAVYGQLGMPLQVAARAAP